MKTFNQINTAAEATNESSTYSPEVSEIRTNTRNQFFKLFEVQNINAEIQNYKMERELHDRLKFEQLMSQIEGLVPKGELELKAPDVMSVAVNDEYLEYVA